MDDKLTHKSQDALSTAVRLAAAASRGALLGVSGEPRGGPGSTSEAGEDPYKPVETSGVHPTKQAGEGTGAPVAGRDADLGRVTQVLSRRTKNNPVLIGEPGV